ncbi:unnamed protein product [Prorocentrum cordatum]|uniref:Uncharacterized protein n=1 Tax=Prorocentrum cordatum TaxID=2364126 RepID=A0ABN9QFH1_9DINO|nr:unnamed protein product [Polarella glacialis]
MGKTVPLETAKIRIKGRVSSGTQRSERGSLILKSLMLNKAPATFLFIVSMLLPGLSDVDDLDSLEAFAEHKAITNAYRRNNYKPVSLEYNDDALFQNVLTDEGFAHWIAQYLRIKPGGASNTGIARSSWVAELYRPLPNGFKGSSDLVIVDNSAVANLHMKYEGTFIVRANAAQAAARANMRSG